MMPLLEKLGQRALFCLDPETAHGLSIAALKLGVSLGLSPRTDPRLATSVAGIDFPNPLGMAAGYDKNGEVPDALLQLGFGFVEIGTLTPLPQTGNPRPRIFRLTADRAVINRLGFNNEGQEAALKRLNARIGRSGIVGVNIGANKDSADRIGDYALGAARFAALASYLTVNISSPNTPGLRNLQSRESLRELLARVRQARDEALAGSAKRTPVFLKIAPDLAEADLEDIAAVALEGGLDGLIVSNTTIQRPDSLRSHYRKEAGGLSGRPLFELSTAVLKSLYRLTRGSVPLIGVGGVTCGETAYRKLRAGASLIQLYSALTFQGPGLITRIKRDLAACLRRDGLSSPAEAIGLDVR